MSILQKEQAEHLHQWQCWAVYLDWQKLLQLGEDVSPLCVGHCIDFSALLSSSRRSALQPNSVRLPASHTGRESIWQPVRQHIPVAVCAVLQSELPCALHSACASASVTLSPDHGPPIGAFWLRVALLHPASQCSGLHTDVHSCAEQQRTAANAISRACNASPACEGGVR